MRLGALAVLFAAVTACSAGTIATTTTTITDGPSLRTRTVDFAVTADRALIGTRFEDVTIDDLARAVEGLCSGTSSFDEEVRRAVAGLSNGRGPNDDDLVATEVLVAGVVEVCPERIGAVDVIDLYLQSVASALDDLAVGFDPLAVLEAGPAVCGALDDGDLAESAYLAAAESLFGVISGSIDDLPDEGVTPERGLVVGATVAAAVEHLCSQHRQTLRDFLDGLGG